MTGVRKIVAGRPLNWWLLCALFIWGVVAALVAHEVFDETEFLLFDPVAALAPAALSAFFAVGATWLWYDSVAWWRRCRDALSLIKHYVDGRLVFNKPIKGTIGILEINGEYSIVPAGPLRLMRVYEYMGQYHPAHDGSESEEFIIPKELLTSLSLLSDRRGRFHGLMPALLMSEPFNDVYLIIIDPQAQPKTRLAAERESSQALLTYDNSKVITEAYPVTGESISVRLECTTENVMYDNEIIKGAKEPVKKTLHDLGNDAVVIAVPKYEESPAKITKAIGLKWPLAIGAILNKCELRIT